MESKESCSVALFGVLGELLELALPVWLRPRLRLRACLLASPVETIVGYDKSDDWLMGWDGLWSYY